MHSSAWSMGGGDRKSAPLTHLGLYLSIKNIPHLNQPLALPALRGWVELQLARVTHGLFF